MQESDKSDIEDKNFVAALRNIDRYKICLTVGQLETILRFHDPIFNKIFIDLCDLELIRKKGISLNFIDLSKLIDQARNEAKKKEQIDKDYKKSTFSQKKGDLNDDEEERSDDIPGPMELVGPEVQKKLDNLDRRLKSVESRLNEFEKSIKGGV